MAETVLHHANQVETAWEGAYKESLITEAWEQAAYLTAVVGARFVAAGVGLAEARTVRRWVEEGTAPREHDVAARLALLFRVTKAVADVYTPAVAAAFLRSANPQLDDESPLLVLREGDPEIAGKHLLAAARAFLEG